MGWLTAMREDFYPDRPLGGFPIASSFAVEAARALAWAAQLAYEVYDRDKFHRILGRWNWQAPRIVTGRFASYLPLVSTKGFMATAGGDTVIAFAGTEPTNLLNWITDLSIHQTAEGVHSGFEAAVEAVWPQVREAAEQAIGGICLAGHSLGGALAAVAAKRLLDCNVVAPDRLRGVYTIGMPRPGNETYARAYDAILGERTYRLVHGDDFVPKIPPAEPPFEFRHVGCVLACPRGGTFAGGIPESPALEAPAPGRSAVEELTAALANAPANGVSLPSYPGANPLVPELVAALPVPVRDHLPDRYLLALQSVGAALRIS